MSTYRSDARDLVWLVCVTLLACHAVWLVAMTLWGLASEVLAIWGPWV